VCCSRRGGRGCGPSIVAGVESLATLQKHGSFSFAFRAPKATRRRQSTFARCAFLSPTAEQGVEAVVNEARGRATPTTARSIGALTASTPVQPGRIFANISYRERCMAPFQKGRGSDFRGRLVMHPSAQLSRPGLPGRFRAVVQDA
jgi:hypothetical protein